MNSSACSQFETIPCSHPLNTPFYYSHKPSLFARFPDQYLALAAPIFAYWYLSLFFHYLDISGWKWLEKYRIHESSEVKARNIATRSHVVGFVFLQQVIQTLLGLMWLDVPEATNHTQNMQDIAVKLRPLLAWVAVEVKSEDNFLYFIYWWGIPVFQFIAAMYVVSCSFFSVRLVHSKSLSFLGSSSTHGSTSYIDRCTSTSSFISTSTPGITVSMFPTPLGHYTITPWRDSCLTPWALYLQRF